MRKTTNKILAFTCLLTGLAVSQAVAQTLNNQIHIGRNGSGTSVTYNGASAGGESYTIVGGGADMWDRTDEFTFAYHELVGDFDIKCQVTYLQPTAIWSKGGIVAKESFAEDSRRVAQMVSPVGATDNGNAAAANSMEMLWRTGNFNVGGDNGGNLNANVQAPQYPNAWIRLVREGAKFRGYVGNDGVTWQQTTEQDTATWNGGAMNGKILVGLGVSRHPSADDNGGVNRRCRGEFTNYVETVQNFVAGEAMSLNTNEVFVYFSRPVKFDANALNTANYGITGGPDGFGSFVQSVRKGPGQNVVILTTDDLIEGQAPYVVTVTGVVDTNDTALAAGGTVASFIHPGRRGEYALNSIHVRRNQFEGQATDFLEGSTAYAKGIPTSVFNKPNYDTNSLFEDTLPTGDQPSGVDRYTTRIVGVLNVPTAGNYGFGIANDDHAKLYLSPNDQLADKSLIATRLCCNGVRDYPNGGLSPLIALTAGSHLLEYLYAEGGGGNYGAVAWDAGTGTPIANGQTPIPAEAFTPSRFAYNTVFYSLGAPAIVTQPVNHTNFVGGTADFWVVMDGTPPYAFTWYTNGVRVDGATGSMLVLDNVQGYQNGMTVRVSVTNDLGGVTSSTATLTVFQNPKLVSVQDQGNCHSIVLNFNRLMNLDGTYTVSVSNNVPGAVLHTENFNTGDGGYTVQVPLPHQAPWGYNATSGSWTNGGHDQPDNNQQNTSYLISPAIALTAGGPLQLSFAHRYSFETGGGYWDGGIVQYSVNGGAFITISNSSFIQNGYIGALAVNVNNALSGQTAFVGNSINYASGPLTSVCVFGNFTSGDSVVIRFMAASDANTTGASQPSWEIDSVQVNAIVPGLVPLTVTGPTYGSSQQQIRLGVSPNLIDGGNYVVSVSGATSQGDSLVVDPNPTTTAFVFGSAYGKFNTVFRRYNGVGNGGNLANFQNSAKFKANQYDIQTLNPRPGFETVTDQSDDFGAVLFGWAVAPVAGNYYFWISSDDQSALYISTDANPANKVSIATEPQWAGSREYASTHDGNAGRGTPPSNGSVGIPLTAGQVIYLEGNYAEGGGGDNFSAAVVVDSSTAPANGSEPIPRSNFLTRRIAPSGFIFDTLCDVFLPQPIGNKVGFPSLTVTFTAKPDGTPIAASTSTVGYYYQWSSNGVAIAGATSASYTTAPLAMANSGDTYSVVVSNDFSFTVGSASVIVEERPVLISASTRGTPDKIFLQYNIPVIQTLGDYVVTNSTDSFPLDLASISAGATPTEVVLTTVAAIPLNSFSGLTATGVLSTNGVGVILPNPTYVSFYQGPNSFCPNLTAGLPAGAALYGTPVAVLNTTDGTVQFTTEANDQAGGFVWGDNNASSMDLDASFDFAMYKTLDADPADGFSFNIAQNLPQDNTIRAYEDGAGSGLSVCFRNYGGNNPGYRIVYNGVIVGYVNRGNRVMATVTSPTPPFKTVRLQVTATGKLSLQWGSDKPFTYLQLPNYTGLKGKFGMYARNGGLNHISIVRNICINNFTLGNVAVALSQSTSSPAECSTVSFTATPSGSPPFYYQWLRNATPIAGANNPTYTTPAISCPADQGAVYAVVVTNLFSAAAASGTALAVGCDNTPPTLVSVGSTSGNAIGAQFSEGLDPATAINPLNYSVNGGPFGDNVSGVSLMPSNNAGAVIIGLSNALTGNFTLTVSNILESCPARNATNSTAAGSVLGLASQVVGGISGTSTNASFAAQEITIVTGGGDTWGNADNNQFVYTERCGDFDIQTKVARLDYQSGWTKGGLIARVSLAANSPAIATYCTPTNGANQVEAGIRTTVGGGMGDWGAFRPPASLVPWIRLTRTGSVFKAFHSADGINWTNHATTTQCSVPTNLYVGVFATPNNGNNGLTTTAQFVNYQLSAQGVCGPKTTCGLVRAAFDGVGNVTITWDDPCCRLQYATELNSNPALTVWTDIAGTSPINVSAGNAPNWFFRTISP